MEFKNIETKDKTGKPKRVYILIVGDVLKLQPLVYVPLCGKYIDSTGKTYSTRGWKEEAGPDQKLTLFPDKEVKAEGFFCGLFGSVFDGYQEQGGALFRKNLFRDFVEAMEAYRDIMQHFVDDFTCDIAVLNEKIAEEKAQKKIDGEASDNKPL